VSVTPRVHLSRELCCASTPGLRLLLLLVTLLLLLVVLVLRSLPAASASVTQQRLCVQCVASGCCLTLLTWQGRWVGQLRGLAQWPRWLCGRAWSRAVGGPWRLLLTWTGSRGSCMTHG
jgi:hypothetical protein